MEEGKQIIQKAGYLLDHQKKRLLKELYGEEQLDTVCEPPLEYPDTESVTFCLEMFSYILGRLIECHEAELHPIEALIVKYAIHDFLDARRDKVIISFLEGG